MISASRLPSDFYSSNCPWEYGRDQDHAPVVATSSAPTAEYAHGMSDCPAGKHFSKGELANLIIRLLVHFRHSRVFLEWHTVLQPRMVDSIDIVNRRITSHDRGRKPKGETTGPRLSAEQSDCCRDDAPAHRNAN